MVSFNHQHKALSIHRISRIINASIAENITYVEPDDGGFSSDYVSTALDEVARWVLAGAPNAKVINQKNIRKNVVVKKGTSQESPLFFVF